MKFLIKCKRCSSQRVDIEQNDSLVWLSCPKCGQTETVAQRPPSDQSGSSKNPSSLDDTPSGE